MDTGIDPHNPPVASGILIRAVEAAPARLSNSLITITPKVVNDNQQAREVTAEFRKKMSALRKIDPAAVDKVIGTGQGETDAVLAEKN